MVRVNAAGGNDVVAVQVGRLVGRDTKVSPPGGESGTAAGDVATINVRTGDARVALQADVVVGGLPTPPRTEAAGMTAPAAGSPSGLLVLLVGAPGSGKSTWALRHFPREQVVSSDELRAAVCGDPNDQAATPYAVRLLHTLVEGRLRFRQTTVVDATNGEPEHREALLRLAQLSGVPAVAVVFDVALDECLRRNAGRLGARRVPEPFLRATHRRIRASLPVTGPDAPAGFAAALVLGAPRSRLIGQLPPGYAEGGWLAGAAGG